MPTSPHWPRSPGAAQPSLANITPSFASPAWSRADETDDEVVYRLRGPHVRRIALGPTAGLIALTVFDLVIVVLTWREYRQHRRTRTENVRAGSAPTPPAAKAAAPAGSVSTPAAGRPPIAPEKRPAATDERVQPLS